jgi:nucleoside-diphosphate-sugar epimerase
MDIFITGATGYLGAAIVAELTAAGHAVTGLVRSPQTPEKSAHLAALGARTVVGDLKEPASYSAAAAAHEVLLHAGFEPSRAGVATDRTAVETLLAAAGAGRVRQVIYTSGLWVLGATVGDQPADEDTPPGEPPALVAWRPAHERLVLDAAGPDLATAVIRPGLVYGGAGGLTGSYFASAVEHGAARFVGDGHNWVNPIHLHDLARLYRAVVQHQKDRGRGIFHGVDGRPLPLAELARAASAAAGRGGATESIPLAEARSRMGSYADALALHQVVQSRRGAEIGWQPRHVGFAADAATAFEEWRAAREPDFPASPGTDISGS